MSDVEQKLYAKLKEVSEEMSYNERVEYGLSVYFNLVTRGLTPKEAVRVTTMCTDVPSTTLRRWRDRALEDGTIPEDGRGSVVTGMRRWILALIEGQEED